ncbi:unnamed protein product [Caenorhabditis angaria]|uniref:MYND-type domain-containing protein n=1 Tax=Caenorhabditis angaria TaxID=860376 RepID=A0A9P1IFU8_9PELO|nr:unnamed protein product [Caenorhabditis angaria]
MQVDPHDTPVHLGFGLELQPSDLYRLKSHYLPLGKIGGKPAWLNPQHLPKPDDLLCKTCQKPCAFLAQITANSPQDPEYSFHRFLYFFVCRNPTCSKINDSSNLIALRCGLPRKNAFFGHDGPIDPDFDGDVEDPHFDAKIYAKCCAICGCSASKKCAKCQAVWYCSKEHQAIDWKIHKTTCCAPEIAENPAENEPKNPANPFVFKEFGMEIDQEYVPSNLFDGISDDEEDEEGEDSDDETEEDRQARMKEFNKFVQQNKDKNVDLTKEDLDQAVAEQKKDQDFEKFNRLVSLNPDQIIRYKRNGEPLKATSKSGNLAENQPEEIACCDLCGKPRRFELQLMPHLLSLIDVDAIGQSIDWASVYIYTCSATCQIPNDGYAKEFVTKQDFID